MVRWEEVKKPVWEGGLGLKSIVELNQAFHGKWLWRSLEEKGKLWWKVVRARWGDWEKESGRRGKFKIHKMRLWRKIREDSQYIKSCVGWNVGRVMELDSGMMNGWGTSA